VKHFKLHKDTIILISKIDKWLRDEYSNGHNSEVVFKTREVITKIMKRGWYSEQEREFLNELRSQYISNNQSKDL